LDRGDRDTFAVKPLPKDGRRFSNPDKAPATPFEPPRNAYESDISYDRFQGGNDHRGTKTNQGEFNKSHGRATHTGTPQALAASIPNRFQNVSKPRTTHGNFDNVDDSSREKTYMSTEEFKKRMHQIGPHQGGNVPYEYPARKATSPSQPGISVADGPSRKSRGSVVVGRRGDVSSTETKYIDNLRRDYKKKHVETDMSVVGRSRKPIEIEGKKTNV
jgi:hypothetical protein